MHTTLDLPPDLVRDARDEAIRRGATLDEMVSEALTRELARRPARSACRVRFPVFSSASPVALEIDADIVRAAEEDDDLRRSGVFE